jgi:hypothetical protein
MTSRSPTFELLPPEVVDRARAQTREGFVASEKKLLIIALPDAGGELAQGLADTLTSSGTALKPTIALLSFQTSSRVIRGLPLNPRDDLRKFLQAGPHFVAPLRKRPIHGKPFADRISIGRARNNDIVLRQADVSKFHAWLECDEDGEFYVADAGGRNPTTLRGQAITRQLEPLRSGDVLTFGSVRAVYCHAGTLWEVLQ